MSSSTWTSLWTLPPTVVAQIVSSGQDWILKVWPPAVIFELVKLAGLVASRQDQNLYGAETLPLP